MSFYFQDPVDPQGSYLLEHMLAACASGATSGGGLFAWTTASGLALFLEDVAFKKFAIHGTFDLVLGIDTVTTLAALRKLTSILECTPSLTASVFLHDRPRALFHPKVCWFAGKKSGTLITGSGNLTVGGLRSNWEAFTVNAISPSEARAIQSDWTAWRSANAQSLFTTTDTRVLAAAETNRGWICRRAGSNAAPEEAGSEEVVAAPAVANAPVLIAEIPRSKDRWKQANFDKANYEQFFGAKVGTQRRVLLQQVTQEGQAKEIESRPSVEVVSQNYRFELAAAAGRDYPADDKQGRPVGVFLRQPTGVILYDVLLPGDAGYLEVARILDQKWDGHARKMRRINISATELRSLWPSAGFWKVGPLDVQEEL